MNLRIVAHIAPCRPRQKGLLQRPWRDLLQKTKKNKTISYRSCRLFRGFSLAPLLSSSIEMQYCHLLLKCNVVGHGAPSPKSHHSLSLSPLSLPLWLGFACQSCLHIPPLGTMALRLGSSFFSSLPQYVLDLLCTQYCFFAFGGGHLLVSFTKFLFFSSNAPVSCTFPIRPLL
jgi:hypothetical protein